MGMMPFAVNHTLANDEAKRRVEVLLDYWKRKYGITSSWNGDAATLSGKAMGVSVDGSLQLLNGKVDGQAKDPGMLLRGQAQKYLTRKFAEYLDASKTIEQLKKED